MRPTSCRTSTTTVPNVGPNGPYRGPGPAGDDDVHAPLLVLAGRSTRLTSICRPPSSVKTPEVVSFRPAFDIVYLGQENSLEWQTVMTDRCVLKAEGTTLPERRRRTAHPEDIRSRQTGARHTNWFRFVTGYQNRARHAATSSPRRSSSKRPFQGGRGGPPSHSPLTVSRPFCATCTRTPSTSCHSKMSLRVRRSRAVPAGSVIASIPVGMGPRGIALSYDGTLVVRRQRILAFDSR